MLFNTGLKSSNNCNILWEWNTIPEFRKVALVLKKGTQSYRFCTIQVNLSHFMRVVHCDLFKSKQNMGTIAIFKGALYLLALIFNVYRLNF